MKIISYILMFFLPHLMLAQVTDFPYVESFEMESTLWTNVVDQAPDRCSNSGNPFVRTSAIPTYNGLSGPQGAIDGSYFVYTDLTKKRCSNKSFEIISPSLDLVYQVEAALSFEYHMFGEDIGTMEVHISQDDGTTWSTDLLAQSISGDQGDVWNTASIDLSDYLTSLVRIRIVGTSTNGRNGFIALDNIVITGTNILSDAIYTYDEAGNRLSRSYEVSQLSMNDPLLAEIRNTSKKGAIESGTFNLYPNPTTDHIIIEAGDDISSPPVMSIFDYSGQLVQKSNLIRGVNRIDFSTLESGVYIIIIENDLGLSNYKVVKN